MRNEAKMAISNKRKKNEMKAMASGSEEENVGVYHAMSERK